MEAVKKSRGNSFWTIAVILNILFSVISVGFFIYKVHVLEGEVFQLRSDLKNQAKARESEDADLMNRNKRAAEYHGESKTCTSCHNACVQLFGLGASAKVFIKISKLYVLSFHSFWEHSSLFFDYKSIISISDTWTTDEPDYIQILRFACPHGSHSFFGMPRMKLPDRFVKKLFSSFSVFRTWVMTLLYQIFHRSY